MPLLFVENLTAIDCSILDPERGLIGASWAVNIELGGDLDQQSMIFDFSKVKKTIKRIIDAKVDHKLLVPTSYAGFSSSGQEQVSIEFTNLSGDVIRHHSPASAICTISAEKINRNSVIDYLQQIIQVELPSNITQLTISLDDEESTGHYYCYSHGLKKHDGNCQRIAHGHRSLIQVWIDGVRDDETEQWLAKKWQDIYIGSLEDVTHSDEQSIEFAYRSEQGEFQLNLPTPTVHLMDGDSTVECIAEHILELVLTRHSNASIKVKAFEGMNKGAIAITG